MPTINEPYEFQQAVKVLSLDITGNTKLSGAKTTHQIPKTYEQRIGTDVVDEERMLIYIEAPTTVRYGRVRCHTAPDAGDKQFTVVIKRSASGGAFAAVSSTVTFADADTDRTTKDFTWTDTTFDAGDVLEVLVDASGSTGNQGQGLLVELLLDQEGKN